MEQLPVQGFIAIGIVLAALIAGSFSFLNLVIAKEQKVSEFRQEWINALRQEIAEYTSAVTYLSIAYSAYRETHPNELDKLKFYESVKESYNLVVTSFTAISLRVNPSDNDKKSNKINDEFLEALHQIRKFFNDNELEKGRIHCNVLREKSIPLLKEEWERVKRGETTYRVSKYVAVFFLLTGLAAGATLAYALVGSYGGAEETHEVETRVGPANPANKAMQPMQKVARLSSSVRPH